MQQNKKCSIIVRTKDEERWISQCLRAVFSQTYSNFEVILVDNDSTDQTKAKALNFDIAKVVTISQYTPGAALNLGIRESIGEYIVFLSSHCIPTNNLWLENLVKTLEYDDNYAGVYGRQEPMSFTSAMDKRDLMLVFGLDKKIQIKDSFFHNANSIIRRECWEKSPFDDLLTNIEDREWGQNMINYGHKLAYEPSASVYHHHGIHQNGNEERAKNIVKIIEDLHDDINYGKGDCTNLNVIALIPQKAKDFNEANAKVFKKTILDAKNSNLIDRVFALTDDKNIAEIAIGAGAEAPFLRDDSLSLDYVTTESVVTNSLIKLEEMSIFADLIVYLEPLYPFRSSEILDKLVLEIIETGVDTIVTGYRESGGIWKESTDSGYVRLDSGDKPKAFKEGVFISKKGFGLVTHPEFIRNGSLYGLTIGIYPIKEKILMSEIADNDIDSMLKDLITK
jgi:rhamnosyltransferase